MSKQTSSELYASLSDAIIDSTSGDFEVISLRMHYSHFALIQTFSIAFPRPVLTMFTNGISQVLAEQLLTSIGNEPLILAELENGIQSDSALAQLWVDGAIKHDSSAMDEQLTRLIQGSRK